MSNNPKKHNIGLLIGRFQPFHFGHLYLIEESLKFVDELKIGIGTSELTNNKNPIPPRDILDILLEVAETESFGKKISGIYLIKDYPNNNDRWINEVKNIVGNFDVYIGNDKSTSDIFKEEGYQVISTDLFKRDLYEGTKIRSLIENKKKWEDRSPHYLTEKITRHYS